MTEDSNSQFGEEPLTDRLPEPLFLTLDHGALHFEFRQLEEAGREHDQLAADFDRAREMSDTDPALADQVGSILDRGPDLPIASDFPYHEPTDISAIRAASPDTEASLKTIDSDEAFEAIHGGWLGACAGCLLGKPVQGWARERIRGFLQDSGQWPLTEYMHSDVSEAVKDRYDIHDNIEDGHAFIDEVEGMPVDDDIDYIVLGLEVLHQYGSDFRSQDVGNTWLETLPLFNTYTAERVAYRNLANLRSPPESATYRNPYREMIGALIRADPWGYAAMGDPDRAVAYAHRDARVSHIKNGVYGELWAAAMIAAAPMTDSIDDILDVGMAHIPANCRLAETIETVRGWIDDGDSPETVIARIHERWDEQDMYDWVHVRSNAAVITLALCASDGDFADAITMAVTAGFDTDSHAATVGSILGAHHGLDGVPDRFLKPLEDSVATSLPGRGRDPISELATATHDVWSSTRSA